jgi:hypothetical protein
MLAFCLIWDSQLWSSGVHEDVQQIEKLATALKNLEPLEFDGQKASQLICDHHLDLTTDPERISSLYTIVYWATKGGRATVFKAILAQDRPQAGLKKGDIIALRVSPSQPKPLIKSMLCPTGYEYLIRLSTFKKASEHPITAYFPDFYGVYFSGPIPKSITIGNYPDHMIADAQVANHRYEEMEWVDMTFSELINHGKKLTDSMIFEFLYGEWAGEAFVGLSINDCKFRNYGLQSVSFARCYHLGEHTYYWADQLMPVRLDLEGACHIEHPRKSRFYHGSLKPEHAETEAGKQFLTAWNERKHDLFTLFTSYFLDYQKTPEWVQKNDPFAKQYFLDQKCVDLEKNI